MNLTKAFILVFLSCILISSCNKKNKKLSSNLTSGKDTIRTLNYLDSIWYILVYEEGGCLTGGQIVHDGKFGSEGCFIGNHKWHQFYQFDKSVLRSFLLKKTKVTMATSIHTCPFQIASEGEAAIYVLHDLYKVNWYDLDSFLTYRDSIKLNPFRNQQLLLREILKNERKRRLMVDQWNLL